MNKCAIDISPPGHFLVGFTAVAKSRKYDPDGDMWAWEVTDDAMPAAPTAVATMRLPACSASGAHGGYRFKVRRRGGERTTDARRGAHQEACLSHLFHE